MVGERNRAHSHREEREVKASESLRSVGGWEQATELGHLLELRALIEIRHAEGRSLQGTVAASRQQSPFEAFRPRGQSDVGRYGTSALFRRVGNGQATQLVYEDRNFHKGLCRGSSRGGGCLFN